MVNLKFDSLTESKHLKSVNVSFRIPYFTHWGQHLLVCGSELVLGSWNVKKGVLLKPFHQNDELIWSVNISVPNGFTCEYNYYVVDDERNILRFEIGKKRKLLLPDEVQNGQFVELHDLWQNGSDNIPFTSAFKNVIFRKSSDLNVEKHLEAPKIKLVSEDSVIVQFRICCPNVKEGNTIRIFGSSLKLGEWKSEGGLKLKYIGESIWQADCLMKKEDFPVKYRYGKSGVNDKLSLESGPNREIVMESSKNLPKHIICSDGLMREMPWRGAGVAIPVFSIRSEEDLGVGEFLDLKLLVDWAVISGFHLIQLLPLNDTSVHKMWWDSYPYSSLSVFALHPLYLRVQKLSKHIPDNIKEEIDQARLKLNGKAVDYEATMDTKLSIAKKVFTLEKDTIMNSGSFKTFFAENEGWLKHYSAFCFLRDFFETSDRSQWGRFSQFSEAQAQFDFAEFKNGHSSTSVKLNLEKLVSKESVHYDIICFHYYIQYHLHLQLSEAADYARENGVILKGDLPIGVDRNSVDTWVYPTLFRMNTATGAPPDYFDKNGQNWGFPTYNWEEMSKDNYAWWRGRLTQMAKYFTAYRIDHILGFFRIWELPEHALTGLCGKFRPSIPLSQEELEKEEIWDFDRLTRPYITRELLEETFGTHWTILVSIFFQQHHIDLYEFKEECNTEKKIAAKLESSLELSILTESEVKLRRKLFDLLQNIVLIRDPEDSRKFYPRFNIDDTPSFKGLDEHSKNVLKRLYYDYYFHRQENLWRENALKTLPVLLNSSDMLACGEDLGLIPSCVHPVMQELGLIGLRIQRMPSEPDQEFGNPSQYPYMTVCAPSCHDCSTLRAWWEEDDEKRVRFFLTFIGSNNSPPPDQCTPEIVYFILRQHVEAPSMWSIFPLQDLLALKDEYATRPATEETINDPTNPKHYWRYRVHVTLETLLKDKDLITVIKDLIKGSGRSYPKEEDEEAGKFSPEKWPEKRLVVAGGEVKVLLENQVNGIST